MIGQIRTLCAASAALVAVALTGCVGSGSTTHPIDAEATALLPSLTVSTDIFTSTSTKRSIEEPAPRSRPHTSHAIEASFAGSRGHDEKTVGGGGDNRPVVLGGQTFTVPQALRYEFDYRYAELLYRYRRMFARDRFGIEGMVGLGYVNVGVRVRGATATAAEHMGNAVLAGGIGALWQIVGGTSLQGRFVMFGDSSKVEGIGRGSRLELYVAQAIGNHAALRVGYASWGFTSEREDGDLNVKKSPIHLDIHGPALGLELMF